MLTKMFCLTWGGLISEYGSCVQSLADEGLRGKAKSESLGGKGQLEQEQPKTV